MHLVCSLLFFFLCCAHSRSLLSSPTRRSSDLQEPPSALAHEDGPAGHDVAVVAFHAEPLRVAVPAVPRTALAFFVCQDRKSTRLNSSHVAISYAVFCLKKKNTINQTTRSSHHS